MNCLFLSCICILLLIEKSVCTSDKQNNLFNFSARLQGKDVKLSQFAGKVVLVVNVASECGYTDSHYKALVKLQSDLEPTGKFTVLAFPCNQFGKQEPGDDEEIRAFAENNYNVNFPVFSKINVIDNDVPAMWSYLINNTEAPTWNFYKYLVDTKGHVVSVWGPWISVEDITQDILDLINGNYHQKEKSRSRSDEL